MKKGTLVTRIGNGITSSLKVKGYAILDDNFISEHDKILTDKNGIIYNVLDFIEIEENTLIMDTLPYNNGWQIIKKSCVKLDKDVEVGNILYIM